MPPITKNLYGDFKYGDGFYGIDIQQPGPKAVTNLFVIREPFYNIIKWDAVLYNVDGSDCTAKKYAIYRTEKTNLQNVTLIHTVDTLDFDGQVDVCWVDQLVGSDQAKDWFYQVVCINDQLIPGVPSDFVGDIFTSKDTLYNNVGLYTKNKNNAFYKILEDIPKSDFIDTDFNVIPYVLKNGHLFIEFFPLVAPGTVLSMYVNGALKGKNYNRGFFYFWIPASSPSLPYSSSVTLSVKDAGGTTTYKEYDYKTYNYLTFIDALSSVINDSKIVVKTVNNDLYKEEIRLDRIYDIFGFPFEFNKPRYLTDVEYKAVVLGDGDRPGLMSSFLNYGGTYKGIKDVVKSIVGKLPKIETYKYVKGMVVRDSIPVLDSGTAQAGGAATLTLEAITGTATSATENTLTDTSQTWPINNFIGDTLVITGGLGAGQSRTIIRNTIDTLRINIAWVTEPDITSTYRIDWAVNKFIGDIIKITGGTGIGQLRRIVASTATTITVSPNWTVAPNATSTYTVYDTRSPKYILEYTYTSGTATGGGAATLTDTSKSWYPNIYTGRTILITEGTGVSQFRVILSNTSNTITVDENWDIIPDNTSKYIIFSGDYHTVRLFSIAFKAFTLKLTVYDGIKSISGEQITSTGEIDYLDGTHIIGGVTIIDSVGHIYVEGVDYSVDPIAGTITWILGGTKPYMGQPIYCSYQFILRDSVKHLANLAKHAQYQLLIYFYLLPYGFGVVNFGLYPFGAP